MNYTKKNFDLVATQSNELYQEGFWPSGYIHSQMNYMKTNFELVVTQSNELYQEEFWASGDTVKWTIPRRILS